MLKIGVAGDNVLNLIELLLHLYSPHVNVKALFVNSHFNLQQYMCSQENCTDVLITNILTGTPDIYNDIHFDIIVFPHSDDISAQAQLLLEEFEADFIIINADETNSAAHLGKATLITYGLNQKASVTVSSITEDDVNKIQFCIQRGIKTNDGANICEQEFCVLQKGKLKLDELLPAVTVGLLNLSIADLEKNIF